MMGNILSPRMPYAPEHKARTRLRILEHAARLFRRHGYDGIGIDAIMDAAGLTRGAFYAHFRSKADLFAAVTAAESDFVRRLQAARADGAGARAVIDAYLDPANRARVGAGCTLAALTGDVARAPQRVRKAYGELVRRLADELVEHVPADLPDRRARALAAVALCFGGIAIARALADERLAGEVAAACRERALAEVTGTVAD